MRLPALVFLFVAMGLAPAASHSWAQSAPSGWSIDDDAGDQTLHTIPLDVASGVTGQEFPAPATPFTRHADLRKVVIENETLVGLDVVFTVEALQVPTRVTEADPSSVSFSVCDPNPRPMFLYLEPNVGALAYYMLDFQLERNATIHYRIAAVVLGVYTDPGAGGALEARQANALLCLRDRTTGGAFADVRRQPAEVRLEPGTNTIRVHVPKSSLLGMNPEFGPARQGPGWFELPVLAMGDRLTHLRAAAYTTVPTHTAVTLAWPLFFVGNPIYGDVAPNAGEAPAFAFGADFPNTRILARFNALTGLPVLAGHNQSVAATLVNKEEGRRLLRLEAQLLGPRDVLSRYRLTAPEVISVPGGEKRSLTLWVDVPRDARATDNVSIQIVGTSLGFANEVAFAAARLLPAAPVGLGVNTLYLHGRFDEKAFAGPACSTPVGGCRIPYLSASQQDPAAANPDVVYPRVAGPFDVVLSPPLARTIQLNTTDAFEVVLRASARASIDEVEVHAILGHAAPSDDPGFVPLTALAEAKAVSAVDAAGTTIRLSGPIAAGTTAPAGSELYLRLEFRAPFSPGMMAAMAPNGLVLHGGESWVVVPAVALESIEDKARGSPVFQLSMLESPDGFVNPGEGALFNVTLFNQANQTRRARLAAQVEPSTWTAEVLPGREFDLLGGDTVRLGVLVRAPPSANEGDKATVWLNASESTEPPATARMSLVAVRAIDLPDEDAASYRADLDAQEKVVKPPKPSPGPGIGAIVLAVLWMLGRRARR